AVRGVYKKEMLLPIAEVMKEIGYKKALVIYGETNDSNKGMDEASVCGLTYCAELTEVGNIKEYSFQPKDFGLGLYQPEELQPAVDRKEESKKFLQTILGQGSQARIDATLLNGALILYIKGKVESIQAGIRQARLLMENNSLLEALKKWIIFQNNDPEKSLYSLESVLKELS
ncbi:MAG: anthranilate phosphoribosyltransferase, partial [Spirochaetes bacterium]|nr:anthranilate phosphoribosyltransferase [Spirochaetota bacterium]